MTEETEKHRIYTIGHSTHSVDEFITMLQSFGIMLLADVRRFPGSRRHPAFSKEQLAGSLHHAGISYTHLGALGGRRTPNKDSKNNRWRNASFRGYADYMETEMFEQAIAQLEALANRQPTAIMCAEAVWWRCHRALVADNLKAKGWEVLHIMAAGKAEEHPYTSPARIVDGKVVYYDEGLFG